ncbi:hypothetical protein BCR34DRAFT_578757 [Clohesyomyces aquaticus]|uniref:Uncharacterized protein n=1 Tax=Clohesyomyces aquaticus TaxID=1231657 RepID=A0A1Y1YEA0_9PLEO|nr:hypothetical protein BCR34DRAFT_578757 [Clohesyomyces aquaticus]
MKNDLRLTFGEIFRDLVSFRAQLHYIKSHTASRIYSELSVSRPRFLDISGVPDLGRHDEEQSGERQRLTYLQGGSLVCSSNKSTLLEIPVTE